MPLTRERPRTPAFPPPAPLPSLSDALARRAAVFGPVDLDDAPVALRRQCKALPAQHSTYVPYADVRHLRSGNAIRVWRRPDGPGDHGRVLRQHHLRGTRGIPLAVVSLVAALACHLRLPGSSWLA